MSVAEKIIRAKADYDEVYDAGKQAEHDRFWDSFQNNGNRRTYYYTFYAWSDENFYPKYDIISTGTAQQMFSLSEIVDLEQRLIDCGVQLDVLNSTHNGYMFYGAKTRAVPVIDLSRGKKCDYFFYNCTNLVTVRKIKYASNGSQDHTNSFTNCTELEHLIVEGKIGQTYNLQHSSKLTLESAKSVLSALVNYAGTANELTYSVYLHDNVWELLETDGATSPNETMWRDYVAAIGWNT